MIHPLGQLLEFEGEYINSDGRRQLLYDSWDSNKYHWNFALRLGVLPEELRSVGKSPSPGLRCRFGHPLPQGGEGVFILFYSPLAPSRPQWGVRGGGEGANPAAWCKI